MSKINQLQQTLIDAKQPLSFAQIQHLYPNIAKRTIQRWLKQLAEQQAIIVIGQARSRQYSAPLATSPDANDDFPAYIPLGSNSQVILNSIINPFLLVHL